MNNLTETQKEILNNLEIEFLKLNIPVNTKSTGLINVNKIRNLLDTSEKESKEIDLWNKLQERLYEDYKVETFAKLEEALYEMGIGCELKKNSIVIGGRQSIYFKGLKCNYIRLGNEQTKTKYVFEQGLSIYFNPHSENKFDTLEELCANEQFEKILITMCNK